MASRKKKDQTKASDDIRDEHLRMNGRSLGKGQKVTKDYKGCEIVESYDHPSPKETRHRE